jgi:TRAP-type C4-dicarboxylate transport system substrate-binding protein
MKKILFLLLISALTLQLGAKPKYNIKFAALAPKGSTWMNILEELDKSLRAKSNGELGFTIYPGGVAGDEKKVLRKMRINQIQAAGLTGVGLGAILPEERIFDSPFLFRSEAEVDYITEKFFDRFAEGFKKKGYTLLGWAEVGFVYVYTKEKVNGFDEMKKVKMWSWEGDPVASATFTALGLNPIPLSITDVITSLQSGIINAVYSPPLAAVAFQWHTRVNYMFDLPIANAMGAVIISNKFFNKLPEKYQKLLLEESKKYFSEITSSSRKDNTKSIEVMKKQGIKVVEPFSQSDLKNFEEAGKKARRSLVGKLYDDNLLNTVEQALEEFRKRHNTDNK